MRFRSLLAPLLLACSLHAAAAVHHVTDPDAARALPAQGAVAVRWEDPAQFSELRNSRNRAEASRGNWVVQLAEYLRSRAERRLPPGERLEVDITDIQRAGNYEPWRGVQYQDVRVLRELYPPQIKLGFRRLAADGHVIAEGERTLSDPGYLLGSHRNDDDPLRFEKALLDRWLARELAPAGG